jgi:hypothetical protein
MSKLRSVSALAVLTLSLLAITGLARGEGDLRSAAQNPLSAMSSLPFKLTFDTGASNGDAAILNIQPVMPVNIGEWNIVNRAIIPIADVDGAIQGPNNPNPGPGGSASGLGDINYSAYFSPVKYDKVIWGIGPSLNMPTASDDQLGSGKWSGGITGVVLTITDWGSTGGIIRQLWSFSGEDDRSDVNQTLIEPFLNYNLSNGWYLLTDIVMTANWEADSSNVWTVPVGGGVGRVFNIGSQPVKTSLEAYYNVARPEGAPNKSITFGLQFLFPKS